MKGEQLEAPGMVALIAALISILLKEILYNYTVIKGKNLNSQAVVAMPGTIGATLFRL